MTELDVMLYEPGGGTIDTQAVAHEVSASGFRVESRVRLEEGAKVVFEIVLPQGDRVKGSAEVIWVKQDEWGATIAGTKITKISWRDKSKLKQAVYRPGFDFVTLARRAFWCFYVVVVVAALQNVLLAQPLTREVLWTLLPVIAGLIGLGWGLLLVLG